MNDPTRTILIFTAYYPPHMGGVERYAQSLGRRLLSMGNKVVIVTSSLDGVIRSIDDSDDVDIIEIPSRSILEDRFPIIMFGKTFKEIQDRLIDQKATDIVINTRYYPLSVLACSIARKLNIRPLIIDHSSGYLNSEKTLSGAVMRLYERGVTSWIKQYNPIFAAVSHKSGAWLREFGISSAGIVPNSINADEYKANENHRNWRKELGIAPEIFMIVFAGRLIPEKGLPKLLAAAELLQANNEDFTLVIAGNGPLGKELSKNASPWLKFVGKLEQPDLSSLLRASDCFCLPTEYPEGLPTILLEAAVQENAIIVSNCAGAQEVIPGREYGTILDSITPHSIANAIAKYNKDRDFSTSCALNASRFVSSNFSWDKAAQNLISLLEKKGQLS